MADSSILSNTKTFIRSTLLSQKGTITATQLNRDYRELVGDYIPYHKLQFRDLESFLAAVPDVCHVDWDGGQMVVTGVAGKASGHIKEMVSKQKTKSGGGKRFRGYWNGGREREVRSGYRYNS